MDVRNCKTCGKLFNHFTGPPLCPACVTSLDKKFEDVKEYVYDHPRVDMQEVSEVFEVSIRQIKQWIREERLAFADDSMIGIDCESCGTTIKTGRYCKHCKEKLARGFEALYRKPETELKQKSEDPKVKSKMRFLDQDRN